MPNKTQEYLNLAQQTAKELTRHWENWTDYLTHCIPAVQVQLCRPAHDLCPAS